MKKNKKILIIEDSSQIENAIKSSIDKFSDDITISKNASDAIKSIEKGRPDLIIIDLELKSSSGFELTRIIKQNYGLPVIALADENKVASSIRADQEGADAFVSLPFKHNILKKTIEKLF